MIERKTVFVLGAGSSYPYGFPLGRDLRIRIIRSVEDIARFLDSKVGSLLYAPAIELKRKFLNSSDLSIDWFLKKFPEYIEIGKYAIIDQILLSENDSKFREFLDEKNKDQDWYWYLYNEMSKYPKGQVNPELFLNNKISFITFNYDRSLEHFLYTSLSNGHKFESSDAVNIFSKLRIEHVYGKVALLDWEKRTDNQQPVIPYGKYQRDAVVLEHLRKNIRLIDEREKADTSSIINLLKEAERIFFLGFSFADENMEILNIPNSIDHIPWIYGTAYGMTDNEIRKIRGKFFYNISIEKIILKNVDCLMLLREFL